MLILTRRSNEKVYIGDDVVLVVLGIENNRVKLGIEAPSDVTILREELVTDSNRSDIDCKKASNSDTFESSKSKTG